MKKFVSYNSFVITRQQINFYIQAVIYSNLIQLNKVPNKNGVFLYFCFSNVCNILFEKVKYLWLSKSHHHYAYTCELGEYYDFCKADMVSLNYYLAIINWDVALSNTNIDTAVTKFYYILFQAIPKKHVKNSPFPVWNAHELKTLVNYQKENPHKLMQWVCGTTTIT